MILENRRHNFVTDFAFQLRKMLKTFCFVLLVFLDEDDNAKQLVD